MQFNLFLNWKRMKWQAPVKLICIFLKIIPPNYPSVLAYCVWCIMHVSIFSCILVIQSPISFQYAGFGINNQAPNHNKAHENISHVHNSEQVFDMEGIMLLICLDGISSCLYLSKMSVIVSQHLFQCHSTFSEVLFFHYVIVNKQYQQ